MDKLTELISASDAADLLACTLVDLRNWRKLPVEHPGHLPSIKIAGRHFYDRAELVEWLARLPERLAVAKFAAEERSAFPLASAVATADELRTTPASSSPTASTRPPSFGMVHAAPTAEEVASGSHWFGNAGAPA